MNLKLINATILFCTFVTASSFANSYYKKVSLICKNPGSHQDVAKTPYITNQTQINIAANKLIYWQSTDGDKGQIQGPLNKGATRQAIGNPGNGYQCTAWFYQLIAKPFGDSMEEGSISDELEMNLEG